MNPDETVKKEGQTVIEQDLFIDPADIDDTDERAFFEKCDFIEHQKLFDVSPVYIPDFIGEIFERPQGDLQSVEPFEEREAKRYLKWREEENAGKEHDYSEGQFQYNPIVFYKTKRTSAKKSVKQKDGTLSSDKNTHRLVLKDDYQSKDWLQTRYFALMAPITYVGKSTANKNARYLYAFAIDLDGVGIDQLKVLFVYMSRRWGKGLLQGLPIIPMPNIIVNSGHGLHLYYIMRYPLALYEWNAKLLQQFCRALYHLVWYPANEKSGEPGPSTEKKIHCLGIYHSFRMPETMTKPLRVNKKTQEAVGNGVPIRAWKMRSEHYTLFNLAKYFAYDDELKKKFTPKVLSELEKGGRMMNPNRLSLEQARKKYGEEWYNNRGSKGRFTTNRALYDWWLKKISNPVKGGVKEGHRYFCVMALAAFAKKCGIEKAELIKDAESLLDSFEGLTTKANNHFRMYDIHKAIEAYDKENSVRWSPRMIEHWTDIEMKKTKRNKRKQAIHLAGARAIQNINDPEGTWRGRHHETLENSKVAAAVNEWMANHPDSTNKSACARDLNLSRTTVIKWWNEIENTIVESPYDFDDGLLEPGTFASEADPYEEELTRLQQEIIDSITKESNMGAGVFEGETMEVPDIE
ncbi:MAG: hypothetical protein J6O49_10240 [Bacteroidaceae bacterium]|nr:hypothetical protein [Bacteroidaceae bacterium]